MTYDRHYIMGTTLMYKVLVNLHGKEHQFSRKVDAKKSRPDASVINWTVSLRATLVKLEQEKSGQN